MAKSQPSSATTKKVLDSKLDGILKGLRGFIAKRISSTQERQDLLQSTILSAYENIRLLKDDSKLDSWVKGIALHKIHRYYFENKRGKFAALHQDLSKPGSTKKKLVLEEIDSMFRQLTAVESNEDVLVTFALRFCLDWSPQEIALALKIPTNTIYQRLSRTKQKLKKNARTKQGEIDPALKVRIIILLRNRALLPPEGLAHRNSSLADETLNMLRLIAEKHPNNYVVIGILSEAEFTQAQQAEYADDFSPHLEPYDFHREKWDKKMLASAKIHYRQFKKLNPAPHFKLRLDYIYHLFSPRTNAEVDWKKLYQICEDFIKLRPVTSFYLHASYCKYMTTGPMAAVRYLKDHGNNLHMKDNHHADRFLGKYYFKAKKWKEARSYLKKYLSGPCNKSIEGEVQTFIQQCDHHLK